MSRPVKNLVVEAYRQRFQNVSGAALVNIRGIDANDTNRFREDLAEKGIKVAVVKNSLARRAFEDLGLVLLKDLIDGPSAMVYPVLDSASVVGVARELINWTNQIEHLEFKGALMEGMIFGPDQIDELSRYPTRSEAQAQIVQIILSPSQNLVGAIQGPGRKIASLIKAIQEKLEKK